LGLVVNRLIRLSFGPFQLGEMAEGAIEEVRTRVLREQLGPALTAAAGADFEAPVANVRAAAPPERNERKTVSRDSSPRHFRPRPHRAEPSPEPEVEKPRHRPKPGARKHVSVLRADVPGETRRRTIASETSDRKGRSIVVERKVVAVAPAEPTKAKQGGRGKFLAERGKPRFEDRLRDPRKGPRKELRQELRKEQSKGPNRGPSKESHRGSNGVQSKGAHKGHRQGPPGNRPPKGKR
jgi:23S rRNA pseudouridine2605 synthase